MWSFGRDSGRKTEDEDTVRKMPGAGIEIGAATVAESNLDHREHQQQPVDHQQSFAKIARDANEHRQNQLHDHENDQEIRHHLVIIDVVLMAAQPLTGEDEGPIQLTVTWQSKKS